MCLTPRQYHYKVKAYERKREREWELYRWLGAIVINSQRSSKQAAIKPSDLVSLQIDEASKESDIKELKEYHRAMNQNKKVQRWLERKLKENADRQ